MFRRKKKIVEAEQQKLPDLEEATPNVRGRKYEVSTQPRSKVVSKTSVKNPVEMLDDYNPANKYGVDDRLLTYFYTKGEIDEMDFGDDSGGGQDFTAEIEELNKRVDDEDEKIAELRRNEEYLLDKIESISTGFPMADFDYSPTSSVQGTLQWNVDPTSTYYLYHYTALTNSNPTGQFCEWAGMTSNSREFVLRSQVWVQPGSEDNAGLVKDFSGIATQAKGKVQMPKSVFRAAKTGELAVLQDIVGQPLVSAYSIKGTDEWICNQQTNWNGDADPRVFYAHAPLLNNTLYSQEEEVEVPAVFDEKVWEEWLEEQKTLTDENDLPF